MPNNREVAPPRFYGGLRALPLRLKFMLALWRYALQKKKYPLFAFSASRGGLAAARPMLRELKLCKYVKHDGRVVFSLQTPRWPSAAFDRMAARGGLNITASGTPFKQQIDMAILAITGRCAYACRHCYEHFNITEDDTVPVERWAQVISGLQAVGTSVIVFSGGEPMLRFDGLVGLLRSADHGQSEFHLHTSGHGVSRDNARELKEAGLAAAAVGLDDVEPDRHDALRGYPGAFGEATRALRCLQEAGVFTYINTCLTKEIVRAGDLPRLLRAARDMRVGVVRLLEPRPCGGYLGADVDALFSEEDRAAVTRFYEKANLDREYRDCPLVSYEAYLEAPGRLGCLMGGHAHLHIDSRGHVEPCVFLPVSFGNILKEDFAAIFARMRTAIPRPLHDRCPSLQLAETIKKRAGQGETLPVDIESIRTEWTEMMSRPGRESAL